MNQAIENRRSIRKYQAGFELPREDVERLLEAAMLAPSACNTRPWEFVVVTNPAMKRNLTLVQPYCKALADASLAIVVCGRPELQDGIAEGFWPLDCAAATENLLLQATEMGYGSCWCALYPRMDRVEAVRKLLDVESMPLNIIIVGKATESPARRGF